MSDVSPHAAMIKLSWEIHEKKPDGSYYGASKEGGQTFFLIEGDDYAITHESIMTLIEQISEVIKNVSELKINTERLQQTRFQGSGRPRHNNPKVFSMRGRIGKNNAGRPESSDNI